MAKRTNLSAKQSVALALLVSGQSESQAALAVGITNKRMKQWLRDGPFSEEYRLALERTRQTFEARVMGLANNAAVVVGKMIEDDGDKERQLEGAKLAFNAAVRLSTRYKELQVEGHIAPMQPLVVFPPGTSFPWLNKLPASQPLQLADTVDAELVEENGSGESESG